MAGGGATRRCGGVERGRPDGGGGGGGELWKKVVELTQTAFGEELLAEEATWQAMVMVPKGKGEFRGIGLVEVIWKLVSLILHRRLAVNR